MSSIKTFPDVNAALSSLASRETGLADCTQQPLGGGCISRASVIDHPDLGQLVYKENRQVSDDFFLSEARGLLLLAELAPDELCIPQVHGVLPHGILMERLHSTASGGPLLRSFGSALALLHRQRADGGTYGLDQDNYLGLTPQPNSPSDSWVAFFAEQRLGYQLTLAEKRGNATPALSHAIEKLMARLGEIIPENPPASMLHGDLWGGNYMTVRKSGINLTALIDPAVYRGHYEADVAMTELFGGFSEAFYQGYADVTPLTREYQLRREVYNLYHLLNHLNLFGSGYLSSLMTSLHKIGM